MKSLTVLAVTIAAFAGTTAFAQTASDRARQYPYPQGSGSSAQNPTQYPQGSGSSPKDYGTYYPQGSGKDSGKQAQKERATGQQPKQQ